MPNYKKMYYIVCAAASEAIDAIRQKEADKAADRLSAALNHAEEVYIESSRLLCACDILRVAWWRIQSIGPYILCGIILLALMTLAFFIGGLVGVNGWFMQD